MPDSLRMWECDDCEAAVAGVGYRDAVNGLETHMRNHGCRTGWYSYGNGQRETVASRSAGRFTYGPGHRESVTCRVTRLPDGSFVHEKLSA